MEDRTGCVQGLELIFDIQGTEDIIRIADRQVAGVGIVRCAVHVGGDDVRILFLVMLGQPVAGALCRGGFQVVQVTIQLLVVRQFFPHVVQDFHRELLGFLMGQVLAQPGSVEADFIHADHADRAEVVVEGAQIPLCIRIQAGIEQLCDNVTLDLQGPGGEIHDPVKTLVELFRGLGQVGNPRQVDGYDTDRTGAFAAAEESAALLAQFPQVETQTAAHGADIARFHVRIDIVGEIRGAVLGCHLKQQAVVLCFRPVKVPGNGIGRDRVLEAAAVGIAFNHQLNERLVDHVHLSLAVLVLEVHFLPADNRRQFGQVSRYCPVQGNVGERCLGAPAGRCIDTVNERLDFLLDLCIGQVIRLDERGQISVKAGESLGTGPFVLHDAEEVDHLVAQGGQMLGRGRSDLALDAPEAFLDQLLERPAGTVAGQHAQVMNMDIRVAVGIGDFLVIDFAQPVVGCDRTAVGQDQAAHRIGNGGVFLDPPVQRFQVAVNELLVVQCRCRNITDIFPLLAVQNVSLGHIRIAGVAEHLFHGVLNVFNGDPAVLDFRLEITRDLQGDHIQNCLVILPLAGIECLLHSIADFADIKLRQ